MSSWKTFVGFDTLKCLNIFMRVLNSEFQDTLIATKLHAKFVRLRTRWRLTWGWMLLHWRDSPNNFRWLSRSPPCLHFPSKFAWSPLNPSKVFSDPPLWALSYDWSPPEFCSPKNPVIPPKTSPPPAPPQAINKDRSLLTLRDICL